MLRSSFKTDKLSQRKSLRRKYLRLFLCLSLFMLQLIKSTARISDSIPSKILAVQRSLYERASVFLLLLIKRTYMDTHPEFQKFHTKLPRNGKEFLLFMLIISFISMNIIAPLNMMFMIGFSWENYFHFLKLIPFIWVTVIAAVLLTQKPARKIVETIIKPSDSFNAHILTETLLSVVFIAFIMSIVGTWIGQGKVNLNPIVHFFDIFPRAFTIAFVVEALIAQPIARLVMKKYHAKKDI